MKISIIVPAFNEERLLGATLRQIKAAAAAFVAHDWAYELIVCDNNSSDRTSEVARAEGATVIFEPFNQIAKARNSGAAAASGQWLIFIDADSHPTPELFEDAIHAIQSGTCLAGGCTVQLDQPSPFGSRVTSLWNSLSRMFHLLAGSFIFCDAAAFHKVGGFSKELFAAEELDLTKRLKQLARESKRKIVILHDHPLTTSARKMKLYTPREHVLFLLKTIIGGGKTLTRREACHTWYDGRR